MPTRTLPVAIVLGLCIASCTSPRSAAGDSSSTARGESAVTQSSSANLPATVLNATHIVRATVESAAPGEWAPSSPGIRSRKVALTLSLAEVLFGTLEPMPPATVNVTVTQSDYDGLLMMQPLPGPWSEIELVTGAEIVVFSNSLGSRAEVVLGDTACRRVAPANIVLPGLRIAMKAVHEKLSLAATLALAQPETAHLDPTFAHFLWETFGELALQSQSDFALLAEFSERPLLPVMTRNVMLNTAYNLVKLHGDEKPELGQRLALAMFRVLLLPDAADLHENLIGTDLPNLLGITSGLPPHAAAAVFKGNAGDRDRVKAMLRQRSGDNDARVLLNWIER